MEAALAPEWVMFSNGVVPGVWSRGGSLLALATVALGMAARDAQPGILTGALLLRGISASELAPRLNTGIRTATALSIALGQHPDPTQLRQLAFVSDWGIGRESQLLEIIEHQPGPACLFNVRLGAAPDGWFMPEAAQFGHGVDTLIPTLEEVAPRMGAVVDSLQGPQVTELSVDWPAGGAEVFLPRLPDLVPDQPLPALAWSGADAALVKPAGPGADGDWLRLQVRSPEGLQSVAQLWPRARVESARGAHAVAGPLPHAQNPQATVGFPGTGLELWLRVLLGVLTLAVSGGLFWGATWGVARS